MQTRTLVIALSALAPLLCVPQASAGQNGLVLTKTVGTDPADCSADDLLIVPAGTEVSYCYAVGNTGQITYTIHSLEDSELGMLFSNLPFDLPPGETTTHKASAVINTNTFNVATWTACTSETNGLGSAQTVITFTTCTSATDGAQVLVLTSTTENEDGPDGCTDGVDNDGDGDLDCGDSDCIGIGSCVAPAPALGTIGLLLSGALLAGIGGLSLARRRRG